MPGYQQIPTGDVANDNKGIPNRSAWQLVDEMFAELFVTIDLKADADSVAADIGDINATIAGIFVSLAGKADVAAVAAKADLDQVVRVDLAQDHTFDKRRQHAKNGGCQVTIPFELIGPNTAVEGNNFFQLPRFPKNFCAQDAYFTVHTNVAADGNDYTFYARMRHPDPELIIGQLDNVALGADGIVQMAIVSPDMAVTGGRPLELEVNITLADPYAVGSILGLTLWVRGVWTDPAA